MKKYLDKPRHYLPTEPLARTERSECLHNNSCAEGAPSCYPLAPRVASEELPQRAQKTQRAVNGERGTRLSRQGVFA